MGSTSATTLVTGASGVVGGWLVAALLQRGERVMVLKRAAAPGSLLEREGLEARCEVVCGDVADEALMARIVADGGVQTIFHLAAQSIVGSADHRPAETFTTNIKGTWAVLEAARVAGVRRVVVAGSRNAYGERTPSPYTEDMALAPTHAYDVSKAATDLIGRSYWHTYGLPVAVTRLANVYGGGDRNPSRLVPELVSAALDGRAPRLRTDGTPQRDFLYVEDAVTAYLAIADALDDPAAGARGEAFNAGGGRPVSVREVVATLERIVGTPLNAVYDAAEPGAADAGPSRQYVDTAKIERICGWRPSVDLEEGLRRTVEWYRARRL